MGKERKKLAVVPILCIVLGLAFACLLFAKIFVGSYAVPTIDGDIHRYVEAFSAYTLLCEYAELYSVFYSIFAVFILTAAFGVFGVIVHYDRLEKLDRFVRIGSDVLLIASCIVAFGCCIVSFFLIPVR